MILGLQCSPYKYAVLITLEKYLGEWRVIAQFYSIYVSMYFKRDLLSRFSCTALGGENQLFRVGTYQMCKRYLQVASNDREKTAQVLELSLSQGKPPLLLIAGMDVIPGRGAAPLYLHPEYTVPRPLVRQVLQALHGLARVHQVDVHQHTHAHNSLKSS